MTARTVVSEAAVLDVLRNPADREWSIQGLGMLRTYLDDEGAVRLHIWDTDVAQVWNINGEAPSTIHDHPWDFTSRVYSGTLQNDRYVEVTDPQTGDPFKGATILCGVGGGVVAERDSLPDVHSVLLRTIPDRLYAAGDDYSQVAEELHESHPSRGCVTVITRDFVRADRDHARVFWKEGDWVTAEPRVATPAEVQHFAALALGEWAS